MSDSKFTIKSVDMKEEIQQEILDIAGTAFAENKIEKDIAAYIKKECDKKFGPTWHVIVGRNFGSYVTHAHRSILAFTYPPL
ncbi:Dynein light chain 1, cytoplasmic [Smittium culicis]|uniref:Dynein light chain n=1 Tax=Smittium culicis TaxID=133412 RepID=A0A1R1YBQ6_9FUNG|nr:Dynein light chain 1, cytoplasmic [Smittium culicis]